MSQRFVIRRFVHCLSFAAVLLSVLAWLLADGGKANGQSDNSTDNQDLPVLELNQTVKHEIPAGKNYSYQVRLEAGMFVMFEAVFSQNSAQLALYSSEGELIYRQWRGGRAVSAGLLQNLKRVIETSDAYRLELSAKADQKAASIYELKIAELRPATETDRALQTAEANQRKASHLSEQERKFDEAIALGEPTLATYLKLLPPDAGDIGNLAIVLQNAYASRGYHRDLERREQLLEIAARNREAMFGPDNLHVAVLYNWLAELADPVRAEKWFQKTMDIVVKNVGREHSYVASVIGGWAISIEALGDKPRAAEMYQRAVQLMEKAEGPEYPMLCPLLINHGQMLMDKQELAAAEVCFQRVLPIVEKHPVGDHMESDPKALALYSLAELNQRRGDFAQADVYQQKLLEEYKTTNRLPHDKVWATAYQQRGNFAFARGRYEDAERNFEQARKVLEMTGDSPEFASLLRDWRKLHLLTGRVNKAVAAQRRALGMSETDLRRLLAYGSELQKMKILSLAAEEMSETFSLHVQAAPNSSDALLLAFTTLLQRKGRVLDEMNRTIALLRLSAKGESAELIEQWINKASQISALASKKSEDKDPASQLVEIEKLNREFEQLQSAISTRSAEFRAQVLPPVTLEDVRIALPPDSALIEFAQYQPEDVRTRQKSPPRYLAYVLLKEGAPRWTDLGEVAKIDAVAQSLRQAIGDKDLRADPRPLARKLDELVMRPIRPLLGQAKTIFLSPDGELNLAPFAALRNERGRYLIEDYLPIYLTSGRDLLRLKIKHQSQPDKTIFAVSDFNGLDELPIAASTSPAQAVSDSRSGVLSSDSTMATMTFKPLKYAQEEGTAIQKLFPQSKLYADGQATETLLKQVRRPYFLHLATHGFFLPNDNTNKENALLRSGLVFAGANKRQSGNDDGILTAYEAAALDLWGTKLVVLSACDTGNGEVKNGEGVFGLRRALVLAGAETQISSLWKADDAATQKLMHSFYSNLKAKMGRAKALQQAQLKMLKDGVYPNPYYWANFVCIGEWKPLEQ